MLIMRDIEQSRKLLKHQIAAAEAQLQLLKQQLAQLEPDEDAGPADTVGDTDAAVNSGNKWPLLQDEYRRYGRQMIVKQIGLKGQLSLRNSSVLIVGAGGLGCPAAMYIAGAGVGRLGMVDGDRVENSNLHRQVLHRTRNTGKFKVDSAIEYLQELNPHPTYIPYRTHLTSQNAPDIFASFDIILDCTDNPASRYLISDTAVVLGKPIVSASALRTEGQLMVLNYPPRRPGDKAGGPCYRCVFPKPPPADSVVSCADGGIIGPVVGMMGVMQALETIRVITTPKNNSESIDHTPSGAPDIVPSLHLFSAYSSPPFRNVRLRRRRDNCAACSTNASISVDSLRNGSTDYVQFCGSSNPVPILTQQERISPTEYKSLSSSKSSKPPLTSSEENPTDNTTSPPEVLIDVREKVQYEICSLPNSLNIPISEVLSSAVEPTGGDLGKSLPQWLPSEISSPDSATPIHVVCRLGNDSQTVVRKLKELGIDRNGTRFIGDIKGGLKAWRRDVDPEFPDY